MINDLADHIETLGTRCNIGTFSDTYNDMTMLEWKAGIQPSYQLGERGSFQRRPFLQVIVRDEDYIKGLSLSNDIITLLEETHGEYGGDTIISIIHNGEILGQGRDDKKRWRFLMNFTIRTIGGN